MSNTNELKRDGMKGAPRPTEDGIGLSRPSPHGQDCLQRTSHCGIPHGGHAHECHSDEDNRLRVATVNQILRGL